MPLDSMEFAGNPLLVKLGRVERLLATALGAACRLLNHLL